MQHVPLCENCGVHEVGTFAGDLPFCSDACAATFYGDDLGGYGDGTFYGDDTAPEGVDDTAPEGVDDTAPEGVDDWPTSRPCRVCGGAADFSRFCGNGCYQLWNNTDQRAWGDDYWGA